MTHSTDRTALIIGATGSFGAHAMCALNRRGWTIRALARDPKAAALKAGPHMPVEWIAGDAMNPADVTAAAKGVSVIVHAANPPRYKNWRGLAIPMLAATIAAARAEGARIVYPGNVYNYAPNAGPLIAEDAPQAPVTRKGKVRVEMEDMLRAETAQGVKVLVLRAGDFFGPAAPNSALVWLTTRRAGRVTSVYTAGPAPHAFAYLPDLAETMGRILDHESELADFEVFHFAGHWLAGPDALVGAVRRATGDPAIPLKPFPYPVLIALSPFVTMFRELLEMRYLWRQPIGLDDAKLRAFLGDVPATPLDTAVREALADLDVTLEEDARAAAPAKSWTGGRATPYIAGHVRAHAV
ncbi:MAG TPA: NAD-dependent epimerase/dehydratase family protein [Caulobacteraceae bacterium]